MSRVNSLLRFYIFAADIIWLAIALGLSYGLRYRQFEVSLPPLYIFLLLVGIGIWALLFTTMSLDCFNGGWRFHVVIAKMLRATVVLVLAVLGFAYLAQLPYSRLLLVYFSVLLLGGVLSIRVGFYVLLRTRHKKGHARRVVLVGNERFTREFAFKISCHPELLYQVIGTLYPFAGLALAGTSPERELHNTFDVLRSFTERRVDELIVLQDEPPGLEFQSFLSRCRSMGMRVNLLPIGYELYTSKPKLIEIDGLPLISLESPASLPGATVLKRLMDILIGALLIPPGICVFLASAGFLLWHGRNVLRRELRIGQGGRPFWMYRLDIDRTRNDGSLVEQFIRDLSISEVPQLWNVLVGDMSLVGPRPETPERAKHYSEWQKERLKAKPGMTGLAQINGLREYHGSDDKTRFDLQYLLEWSPFSDLVLIVQTLGTLGKRCFVRGRVPNHRFPLHVSRSTYAHDEPLSFRDV